jgi:hypothetical protein
VFSAHGWASAAALSTGSGNGAARAPLLALRISRPAGISFTSLPIFTIWPDRVPIQTGAPAQIRAADRRPSGTPAVLPGRYVTSVDHSHRAFAAICEVLRDRHSARACINGRPSDRLRFCMCGLVLCGSSAGQSRRKNALPHPGREPRGCLHAGGEQRGHLAAAPGRQTKWGGWLSRRASRTWYWFVQSRASRAGAWSTRFHCIKQQAREVRYIVNFNNGSTTGPNGVCG